MRLKCLVLPSDDESFPLHCPLAIGLFIGEVLTQRHKMRGLIGKMWLLLKHSWLMRSGSWCSSFVGFTGTLTVLSNVFVTEVIDPPRRFEHTWIKNTSTSTLSLLSENFMLCILQYMLSSQALKLNSIKNKSNRRADNFEYSLLTIFTKISRYFQIKRFWSGAKKGKWKIYRRCSWHNSKGSGFTIKKINYSSHSVGPINNLYLSAFADTFCFSWSVTLFRMEFTSKLFL